MHSSHHPTPSLTLVNAIQRSAVYLGRAQNTRTVSAPLYYKDDCPTALLTPQIDRLFLLLWKCCF